MNLERKEKILSLINSLGAVSVKQVHEILRMGSYRNTCRIVNQLSPYLNVVRSQQKIVYLNREGMNLIGVDKEVKKSMLFDHMILANEAYIYFNCPVDWEREQVIEVVKEPEYAFAIQVNGLMKAMESKKLVSDATFTKNGYVHFIEIDNTRHMQDNLKKIKKYKEMWIDIKNKHQLQPILYFFTVSENRKQKLAAAGKGIRMEVLTYNEIK